MFSFIFFLFPFEASPRHRLSPPVQALLLQDLQFQVLLWERLADFLQRSHQPFDREPAMWKRLPTCTSPSSHWDHRQGGRGLWQTKQSFRNGVWPAATYSFHDRARNFTVPFIGPSCSAVAIALIIKGGHLDKDLESSEIWALVFPSTPLGSPRWPGSGTWRSRFPPIVVGFVAGAANSDWLKVCTLRL